MILRVKDRNGRWININAIKGDPMTFNDLTPEQIEALRGPEGPRGPKGDKGADGTMTFSDLTQEQKDSLKGDTGPQGPKGDSYILTADDKTEIAGLVIAALPMAEGEYF